MNVDFRKISYKDFYSLVNEIIIYTYNTNIRSDNKSELMIRFKYYCKFISHFIHQYNIEKLNDFEKVMMETMYYKEDIDNSIKQYQAMRVVLSNFYTFIDIFDIVHFCNKVETDIKL